MLLYVTSELTEVRGYFLKQGAVRDPDDIGLQEESSGQWESDRACSDKLSFRVK